MSTVYFPILKQDRSTHDFLSTEPTRPLLGPKPAFSQTFLSGFEAQLSVVALDGKVRRFFSARNISRFHAVGNRAVFDCEGRQFIATESIGSLTERLQAGGFVRVHRQDLINLAFLRALREDTTGKLLELSDGQQVAVSRRLLPELRRRLRVSQ